MLDEHIKMSSILKLEMTKIEVFIQLL